MNAIFTENPSLAEAVEQIVTTLHDSQQFHIIFALVEDARLRQEAIAALGERLSGQKYLREFNYTRTAQRSLPRFCRNIPRRDLQVCVCAYGLEVLADCDPDAYDSALELLNNHREDISEAQTALVLWLTERTYRDVLNRALDFAAWNEEVVTLALPQNADVFPSPLGELTLEQAEDYRRYVRRYDAMLARPHLAPHFVQEFQRQRSVALAALGRRPDANGSCEAPASSPKTIYGKVHRFDLLSGDAALLTCDFEPVPDLLRDTYLNYILRRNEYMDPRGVMQTTRSAMLKLDEVYVALKAERQTERTWTKDRFGQDGRDVASELRADWEKREEMRLRGSAMERRTESVELPALMRTNGRIVLLGDPGAGKTTLTRFLALHFARAMQQGGATVRDAENADYGDTKLPIFVRISRYADAYAKDRNLSLRRFLPQAFDELNVEPEKLSRLFEDALRNQRALVLLDGLDEIIDPGDRAQIAQRIDEFVTANPGNRFLVTSRIAGYRTAPLGGEFAEFTLEELESPQISRFLNRWCAAYERFLTPDADEADVQARTQAEVAEIESALKENLGVRRLATNPLLLTILCLIKRNGAHLPRRRVELYEIATQTLLRDWELQRGIPGVQCVEEDEALRLLGPLALWLHEEKPTGMASKRDVQERLAELLAKERGREPDDAEIERAVTDFLRRVREHTGLFVERAPGFFGFMHLTFEEYFVGRELVRRSRQSAQRIYAHRHLPRWEEPILLAIGYESKSRPEDAADLIRTAILAEGEEAKEAGFEPSLYEDVLHRDLLFAAHCLGDFAGVAPRLTRSVVNRVVSLYLDVEGKGKYESLRERLLARIAYWGDSESGWEAVQLLLNVLTEAYDIRRCAASALGRLGQATPKVVDALLNLLRDENYIVRCSAASALGQLGQVTPEIVGAILNALRDPDEDVQMSAASVLGQLGQVTPEIVGALFNVLRDENAYIRVNAASALGQLGQATPEIVGATLNALRDRNEYVRRYAASALGRLGQVTPEVVSTLLDALTDEDDLVRMSAALALGRLGQATPKVVDALLNLLRDKSDAVRGAVALALGQPYINVLLDALRDKDSDVRGAAAETLWRLDQATPEVVDALLNMLRDKDRYVRLAAALALGQLGEATPEVVAALLKTLKSENEYLRQYAASALGRLGQVTPEVVSTLLDALTDEKDYVRGAAAATLGQLSARRLLSGAPNMFQALQQTIRQMLDDPASEGYFFSTRFSRLYDVYWEALWTVSAPMEKEERSTG